MFTDGFWREKRTVHSTVVIHVLLLFLYLPPSMLGWRELGSRLQAGWISERTNRLDADSCVSGTIQSESMICDRWLLKRRISLSGQSTPCFLYQSEKPIPRSYIPLLLLSMGLRGLVHRFWTTLGDLPRWRTTLVETLRIGESASVRLQTLQRSCHSKTPFESRSWVQKVRTSRKGNHGFARRLLST